jgi:hypothetical protein
LWVRALIRYGAQLALLMAPMFIANWSLLDQWGLIVHDTGGFRLTGVGTLFQSGTKEQLELRAAASLTLFAFVLVAAAEAVDLYFPKRRLEEFRSLYLDDERKRWVKKLGSGFRLNVMYAKRCWYLAWLSRRLHWGWSYGYRLPHQQYRDEGVKFHTSWLLCQGVCGLAYRRREPQLADLRSVQPTGWHRFWFNPFRLSPWHLAKTAGVKAVLSIPILEDDGRAVGVLNVDTQTDAGVSILQKNESALVDFFGQKGKLLAELRG